MKEQELMELLLEKMSNIETKVTNIEARIAGLDIDLNQVKQAVMETNQIVNRIENKTTSDLNTHSHSIDILNREQFALKTEIEKLKNR
ncbi:hypothetical protein [Paenibacillus sp. 32O-W]|uniref:hypothetical protein n=1 Tax=Paenibacillus sp. 32O-W TaxID=1695218 RepID=UPI0011A5BC1E|nr:hypothetical protein [Paenibacillus sp. 32O-W]